MLKVAAMAEVIIQRWQMHAVNFMLEVHCLKKPLQIQFLAGAALNSPRDALQQLFHQESECTHYWKRSRFAPFSLGDVGPWI